jgi:glutaconate CoA-transferase, subunit B
MADYTLQELRAVFFSRDMADGEVGACGVAAPVPFAAMRLAQQLHAPDLTIVLEGGVNPTPPHLVHIPIDPRAHAGIERVTDLYDMFTSAEAGIDFWFMGGIQVDQHGNLNVHRIGDGPQPTFKGPGIGNTSYASTCRRWYNYTAAHTPRVFVPQVSFVTALGNADGPARRERGPNHGDGCRYVVTSLAVLGFHPDTGRMRLVHAHPGVTVDQVVQNTGFDLVDPDLEVTPTPEPTDEEIRLLRSVIDTGGVLR